MPEAYLESVELVDALRKHRPEWLIGNPDLREFRRLEYDWRRTNTPAKRRERTIQKAGTWERFRFATEKAHKLLEQLSGNDLRAARLDAKEARKDIHEQGITGPGRLDHVVSSFINPPVGWCDDPVAAWRAEALSTFTFYLLIRDEGAYLDWVSSFIDLNVVRRQQKSWTEFWLYDVSEDQLPRQWMRWAFRTLSRFRRVSTGTPGDVQLSAYLYDADFVISNDKLFVELVNEVSRYAPKQTALSIEVKANPSVVEHLIDTLVSLRIHTK